MCNTARRPTHNDFDAEKFAVVVFFALNKTSELAIPCYRILIAGHSSAFCWADLWEEPAECLVSDWWSRLKMKQESNRVSWKKLSDEVDFKQFTPADFDEVQSTTRQLVFKWSPWEATISLGEPLRQSCICCKVSPGWFSRLDFFRLAKQRVLE